MVQLKFLSAVATAVTALLPGVVAAPDVIGPEPRGRTSTENAIEARQGGYYFQNWSEGSSNIRCSNGAGGSFSANWNSKGGFVCGKGWQGGGARTIKYSGTYNATGPGYLAVYGWTRNPLIEYYILESHADLAPNEPWTSKGNFTIENEGTFEVYTSTRTNKPSIDGTRTFQQYWSVRTEKRVGGTVTTKAHFDEWAKRGMRLGGHVYVVMAVEGYTKTGGPGSSGSASITLG
ncbi:concanavalin A-like lectin/glucanase domain-containing protein [Apodospora peruviana]|uniref:Endo-1,4-beta-xylanase n=1 Tax=Apodospora peruviana TaxID=516989 RepID=A0AAE0LY83_9PEZI|nr:concanavalin A-like lectin/glucanase domain-containing protein [Apodospora peruviana]